MFDKANYVCVSTCANSRTLVWICVVCVCVRERGLKDGDKSFGLCWLLSLIPHGVAANSMSFPDIPACSDSMPSRLCLCKDTSLCTAC